MSKKAQCTECGIPSEVDGNMEDMVSAGVAIHCIQCNQKTIHKFDEKKTIELGVYGIVVELDGSGGTISDELHEEVDWEGVGISSSLGDEAEETERYNNRIDGITSMILGHACAGIDISTPAYLEGIESAVQGCANN